MTISLILIFSAFFLGIWVGASINLTAEAMRRIEAIENRLRRLGYLKDTKK